jgi:hypothetical protein
MRVRALPQPLARAALVAAWACAAWVGAPVLEDGPMAPARTADAVSPLDSPPSEPAAAPGEARALSALLGGTRAGAGRLVSPVLGGAATIAFERWELGINLALELQYFDLHLSEPDVPRAWFRLRAATSP